MHQQKFYRISKNNRQSPQFKGTHSLVRFQAEQKEKRLYLANLVVHHSLKIVNRSREYAKSFEENSSNTNGPPIS